MRFKNKVAVVTGASRGLGKSLVYELTSEGATVYGLARNREKLDEVSRHTGMKPIYLDVRNYEEIFRAGSTIIKNEGKLDIWINNAGEEIVASLNELNTQLLREITEVNYLGLVYGTMVASRTILEGDIVQILSTSAHIPRRYEPAYSAAKAAADMFTKSVTEDLREKRIRTFSFSPGAMTTDFQKKAGLPIPETRMNPDDVAQLILYALSLPRSMRIDCILNRFGQ